MKLKPSGNAPVPQFSRFKSPQKWIDNVIENDLPNVDFIVKLKYNGRLKDFGRATLDLANPTTTIGRKSSINKKELIDTLIHEELHQRLFQRFLRGSKRAEALLTTSTSRKLISKTSYEDFYR